MIDTPLSPYLKSRMNEPLNSRVKRLVIPERKMSGFMQKLSGLMFFETMLYGLASKFSKDYSGGCWDFVEIPATSEVGLPARFVYPIRDTPLAVSNEMNCFEGILSPVDFGIGISLIAFSNASFSDKSDKSSKSYHGLIGWMDAQSDLQPELYGFID